MKPTAKKSSNNELPTVFWTPPLSSEISESSSAKVMPKHIEEWLTSLPPASPVSPFPSLEKEKGVAMTEISGQKRSPPFAWYDPDTSLVKMSQGCLLQDTYPQFLGTWPKQGMMQGGRFWAQTMWEQGTGGKGSGFLPTPSQRDWKGGSGTVKFDENGKACRVSDKTGTKYGVRLDALVGACEERGYWLTPSTIIIEGGEDRIEKRTEYRKSIGRQYVPGSLAEQIKWATPSGMDVRTDIRKPEDRSDEANKGGCANLREQVAWPTPRISGQEGYETRAKRKGHDIAMSYLESNVEFVESWPTPRKSEYKDTGPVGSKSHKHMDERDYLCAKTKDPEQPKGQLNPDWVEWLMGWPIFWTSLDPIEHLVWLDWAVDPADVTYDGNYPTASSCQRGPHVGRDMKDLSTESLTTGTRFGMTLETFAKHNPGKKWPSPRAGNPGSRPNEKGGKILAEEAKKEEKIPTPRASDWKDGGWNSQNKDRKEEISCPGYAKTHQGQGIIPRVGTQIPDRVSRLKAIGNGQVPQTTALAFEILTNGLIDMEMQSETTD